MVGKTNMDQFASGLVGTRSPYGVPANAFDDRCSGHRAGVGGGRSCGRQARPSQQRGSPSLARHG
jgi:allophanate hydrolase